MGRCSGKSSSISKDNKSSGAGVGQRHIMILMSFLGFCVSYAMRFNISIAIVAMTNGDSSLGSDSLDSKSPVMFKSDICFAGEDASSLVNNNNGVKQVYVPKMRNSSGGLYQAELEDSDFFHRRSLENPSLKKNGSYETVPRDRNDDYTFSRPDGLNNNNNGERRNERGVVENSTVNNARHNSTVANDAIIIDTNSKEGPNLLKAKEKPEFDWSEADQGFILGSFFWGYLLTQIPGGWASHRYGGKWLFGLGLLVTGLFALVTPFAARLGKETLVLVRIIQGFAGGVTCPAMHALLSAWIPPNERGQMGAFAYAGMPVGNAVSLIVSGHLITWLGWPSVFYLTGLATVIWFALWSYLVYSSPDEHPRISQEEMKYIQRSIQGDSGLNHTGPKKSPPWGQIWKSLPFWGILAAHGAETWGLYTVMTELPTYMKTVLKFDIEENSLASAFPHLLTWVVSIILTQLGDYCIRKQYAKTGTVRKVCNTIALWGSAAALIGVAYSGCNRSLTVGLLGLSVACLGGIYGGVLVNLVDIAPNYAGVLMGISNSVATVPGILAPWIAGMLIDKDPSIERWRFVFFITASISFTGNLLYILMASGEEQEWNKQDTQDEGGDDGESSRTREPVDVPSFGAFFATGVPDSMEMETVRTRLPPISPLDKNRV